MDAIVKVRQERRRVFEDSGARFAAVIWEPALTSPMPSASVHLEQLVHPRGLAGAPNSTTPPPGAISSPR